MRLQTLYYATRPHRCFICQMSVWRYFVELVEIRRFFILFFWESLELETNGGHSLSLSISLSLFNHTGWRGEEIPRVALSLFDDVIPHDVCVDFRLWAAVGRRSSRIYIIH